MFNQELFEKQLEELVNIESGSYDIEGVKAVNEYLANLYIKAGFDITWLEHSQGPKSNSFIVHKGEIKEIDLLLLCHTDTVFKRGELENSPYRKTDDGKRLMGLGVMDMKASCLYALYLGEQLASENIDCSKIAFLFNGQEEISSIGTREVIEKYCKISKYCIALEPARANGECVKERRGTSRYTIKFHGKVAHSGINPQDGESAILEMAHWIIQIEAMNDYANGLSLNCGLVSGGSSVNSVPAEAELKIDVRSTFNEQALEVDRKIKEMLNNIHNTNVKVEIEGGITRPPMKATEKTEEFCASITEEGKKLGLDIVWISTGGGGDASFAGALGVTTVDGMGPVGGKSHTYDEYLELHEIDSRFELLKRVAINILTQG